VISLQPLLRGTCSYNDFSATFGASHAPMQLFACNLWRIARGNTVIIQNISGDNFTQNKKNQQISHCCSTFTPNVSFNKQ